MGKITSAHTTATAAHSLPAAPAWRPSGPLTALLSITALLVLSYLAYRRALPKPLPGIPYNPKAAQSILGDLPELRRAFGSGDTRPWVSGLADRFNSPIVQIFGRRARPTIVVADFRTVQDILLRRNREFERPAQTRHMLAAMIPDHHISMLTSSPQFRRNRELVKDLMAAPFLHSVNAPLVWENAQRFVELWRLKARLAAGRPFDAAEDVTCMTFDVIKNAALGRDGTGLIASCVEKLRAGSNPGVAGGTTDAPFPFPAAPHDNVLEGLHRMDAAISSTGVFPAKLYHAVNNLRPSLREAFKWKAEMLKRQVALAVQRMEAGEPLDSALDYMIQREIGAAKKERRAPVFDSPVMYDECK